jgi:hypothetical protein
MIARILDTGMAKKRISNVDLSWLISEALDAGKHQTRTALAVVPDEKDGWRVIISIRGRRYWTAARMSNVLLTSGRPLHRPARGFCSSSLRVTVPSIGAGSF